MTFLEPVAADGELVAIGGRRRTDLSRLGTAEEVGIAIRILITVSSLAAPLLALVIR
jgi:hypothetical protein